MAKSPEGLAPVRAIFAHGSEEVSIKVSDEGGGNLTTSKRSLCRYAIELSFGAKEVLEIRTT